MYLIEEQLDSENKTVGYWVREKIANKLVESHFVTLSPKQCSCKYFAESHNPHTHFHINVVETWIKQGKPCAAMYGKSKSGKVVTLCPGFIKVKH